MIIKNNSKFKRLKKKSKFNSNGKKLRILLDKENKEELTIIFKLTSRLHMSKLFLSSNRKNFMIELAKQLGLKLKKNLITQDSSQTKTLN
jgi:hypothetical protein